MNDVKTSWENFDQKSIQNAIDAQRKVMQQVRSNNGGATEYL